MLFAAIVPSLQATLPALAAGGVTGSLRGTVVDNDTGKPVAHANVSVASPSGNYKAQTDARGFFSFLQLPVDTYTVGIESAGYSPLSVSGVTIVGDQSQSVALKLSRELRSIANTRSVGRSTSAFQPTQTVDSTQMSGARVDQALGEKGSTDYNQLVFSAPGVIKTAESAGNPDAISIRGSASVEIGYQLDGVDVRGTFFDENPNQGYLNGVGWGHGSVQVVSGAGDSTQGGIGAGVINTVPGRGTYPGEGDLSLDASGPYYNHSLAFQYGIATKDNWISEFFSVRSSRYAPEIAPYGRDSADAGQYRGTSFTYDDDVLTNTYIKIGKKYNQQFQVLAEWIDHRSWAELGGLQNANYYPYDPYSYSQFQTDNNGSPMWGCLAATQCNAANQLAWYQSVIPYAKGVPTKYQYVIQPEQYIYGPNNFLKLGYTRSLGNATALNAFFYNTGGLNASNGGTGNSSDLTTGSNLPGYNNAGGRRVGFQVQAITQANEQNAVTLQYKFENAFPYWDQYNIGNTWQGLLAGRGIDEGLPGSQIGPGPRVEDWYLPVTPGQPVSAANPCYGPAKSNGYTYADIPYVSNPSQQQGCYLYSWLLAHGKWTGTLPTIPASGFDYNGSDFQQWGVALRDQWTPSARLHVDAGLRVDGQNLKWGANPFTNDESNTADIGTGYAVLPNSYLHPVILQPRLAINYRVTNNDSVVASYGRSASFFFGQTAGTPTNAQIPSLYYGIPARDSAANPACGSGWHPATGSSPNGAYIPNPNVYFSGQGVLNAPGNYFKCQNYAQSIYWQFDQAYAAPDIGGQGPATYNNWDLAWMHRFKNNWGSRLTGYWRRGYDTYQATLLNAGPPDPVTGQQNAGSFQFRETGYQSTFGMEFYLTTPDVKYGLSGYFTANYINELTNTPPVSGADNLPLVQQYLYESGILFHQSYLAPLSASVGIQYQFRNGFRINPIFYADDGQPFGVGQSTVGFVNGVLYTLPTGNIGVATPYAGPGQPNEPYNASCYVDPAFAGNYFHPKDFACRGYSEPALAGQSFTRPRLYANLDLEYEHGRATFGAYIANLFNNFRNQPQINQAWQPVSTGQGGLQTGKFANAYPINQDGTPNPLYLNGGRNESAYDQYWLPYQEYYVPGITYRVYAQFKI